MGRMHDAEFCMQKERCVKELMSVYFAHLNSEGVEKWKDIEIKCLR